MIDNGGAHMIQRFKISQIVGRKARDRMHKIRNLIRVPGRGNLILNVQ